jgi:hypothetical protein
MFSRVSIKLSQGEKVALRVANEKAISVIAVNVDEYNRFHAESRIGFREKNG